jgi:hypothetical protein
MPRFLYLMIHHIPTLALAGEESAAGAEYPIIGWWVSHFMRQLFFAGAACFLGGGAYRIAGDALGIVVSHTSAADYAFFHLLNRQGWCFGWNDSQREQYGGAAQWIERLLKKS